MLESLVISLNQGGVNSNDLIAEGFDYLIRDSEIYSFYALKLEVSKDDFKEWFYENISHELFNDVDQLNDFINNVADPWYSYYVEHRSLVDKTKSLKSDCKRWFKKNRDKQLNSFDRFFEAVKRMFEEAYSVHEVVFYDPEAIKKNKGFSADRRSCYINSRKDYFTVIDQMNSYYIMVYRNHKPITRLWGVLSTDKHNIVIFNSYGYHINDLYKLFSTEEEYDTISDDKLEGVLGIHINNGKWLISKDFDLDDFIYEIECPCCGKFTYSDSLELINDRLQCQDCDNNTVYSSYYEEYIDEDEAVYSEIYDSYIYEHHAVYSQYYDDYILRVDAVQAYTGDGYDWVLERDTVYSDYYEERLISDQTVYSSYYDTYLLYDHPDTVYSEWLDAYVDANDNDLIHVNGNDYVPKEDVEEYYILYKDIYYYRKDLRYSGYYYSKWIYRCKKDPRYSEHCKKLQRLFNKAKVITAW